MFMRISSSVQYILSVCGAIAILAGCNSNGSQSGFSPSETRSQSVTRSGSTTRPSHRLTHYYLVTLPTLGGTAGFAYGVNDRGWIVGDANLPGNKVTHATIWINGRVTDLGTLGGPSSAINWSVKGDRGEVAGVSQVKQKDPLREKFCPDLGTNHICIGFRWRDNVVTALPTLGGNNAEPTGVNNRGDVVGIAENAVQDPSCVAPQVLDFYATVWQRNGTTLTLPPFAGDSVSGAIAINNRGQVVGGSGSCAQPFGPSLSWVKHALLWQTGSAIDLGNLGGTEFNGATAINDREQVVGLSGLPGNTTFHAFLWQSGVMTDLGTLPGDAFSVAFGLNNKGQVIGESCDASGSCRAFIWQNGSMTDLNLLVPPRSHLYLTYGGDINDSGSIVGYGYDMKTGRSPAFLALPSGKAELRNDGVAPVKVTLPQSLRMRFLRRGMLRPMP